MVTNEETSLAPHHDFNPEVDTGDFDPVEAREIEEALEETLEGNRRFKRLVLTEQKKQHKRCCKITSNFHGRITCVEQRVFAWKWWAAGAAAVASVLIPVIVFFLVKYALR